MNRPSAQESTAHRRRRRTRLSGLRHLGAPGTQPGTLESRAGAAPTEIHVFAYGPDELGEHDVSSVGEIVALRKTCPVLWVNVSGLGNVELIGALGENFGLHRLALEDVIDVHQRPKVDEYEDHIFIVARMLDPQNPSESEQVSLFMGHDYLLTFQERPGDCFEPVRKRLRDGRGRIRSSPDYLCYALLDALIDSYFPVLEEYGERLEDLEDAVVGDPEAEQIQQLHDFKRDLLMMRRSVWPLRDMISAVIRDEHELFSHATRVYLRDCYDHTVQLMDIIETYREIATGLIDVYISSVSAKLNEVMKVLTIIATIFIPLGFVASLYGMNFDPQVSPWNMPELDWRYGYPAVLAFMALCAGGMLYYFWRKGWIGGSLRRRRGRRHTRR